MAALLVVKKKLNIKSNFITVPPMMEQRNPKKAI
jgi:hypothetical protein